ncbi:MAG: hypothetical protein KDC38_06420 [Planctomycetes bacterium]|nr:hypothetical protein [Planctomycetota bacterium]
MKHTKFVALTVMATVLCCVLVADVQGQIVPAIGGFGWRIQQTSAEENFGAYGQGNNVDTVESEQFVVSVSRTVPYNNSSPSVPGGNFLIYRKVDKASQTPTHIIFPVGPRGYSSSSPCSLALSHNEQNVFITTNVVDDFTLEHRVLVMKVRLVDNVVIWSRDFSYGWWAPNEITGLEIERSFDSTGAASGYTVVGTFKSDDALGTVPHIFAFKFLGSGALSWDSCAAMSVTARLSDAKTLQRNLRWVGFTPTGEVVVQWINTDTGAFGVLREFSISGQFLADPRIDFDDRFASMNGYFMTIDRNGSGLEPLILSAENNGTIRWCRRMRYCDKPVGVVSEGTELFAMARYDNPGLFTTQEYLRYALNPGTGAAIPAQCISGDFVFEAYSFEMGINRLITTTNDYDPGALDRWEIYKEIPPLFGSGPNSYSCEAFHNYVTSAVGIELQDLAIGLLATSGDWENLAIAPFAPQVELLNCWE